MPREVIQLIKAEGRKAIPIPGDLREESFCKELVAKAMAALGGLDVIVSNAGRQQQCEDILQLTTEAFDATIKTNIYAPFWIIKAALPHYRPALASSQPRPNKPTILQATCTIMRRPRLQR